MAEAQTIDINLKDLGVSKRMVHKNSLSNKNQLTLE